jgi:hypothetical protein
MHGPSYEKAKIQVYDPRQMEAGKHGEVIEGEVREQSEGHQEQ